MDVCAEENATEGNQTFAECIREKKGIEEDINPAGMTFGEYTRAKLGEDAFKEEQTNSTPTTTTTENKEDFQLDLLELLIVFSLNFAVTILSYMLIPAIIRIKNHSALDKKKATKVALINSIVVGLVWAVITISAGGEWNATTCVLYYFVNRFVLSYKRKGQV